MRFLVPVLLVAFYVTPSPAADDDGPAKGVKTVEATVEPTEAKPGQTVTLKITVELAGGFHTYPTRQSDKNASSMVNKIAFPDVAGLIFVGEVIDPTNPETKAEPELGIKELKTYSGTIVYERKAVVSPKANSGEQVVKLKAVRLTVCDATNCYPPKTLTPQARFKVLDGPAVPVEKAYQDEVTKALEGK
jgi:hypothetical protein